MRLSLRVRYALQGCFDLAYNGQGEPIQIRVIGERQAIPARYLEQIFQRLRRARLVESKRGPGGGYTLARLPGEITVRDVVEAVEGPRGARGAGRRAAPALSPFQPVFLWGALAERVDGALAEVTLEAICRDAVRAQVRRAEPENMYFI